MSQPSAMTHAMSNTPIAGPIVEQIIAHLKDEKASLEAMLTAVRDVHDALIHLNDDSLRKSLEAEARELISNAAIQQRRHQMQAELASFLQIDPRDVTLRRLVGATTGSARVEIELIWQSLKEMAVELERLNRLNAAMIGQSLAIARGVIEQVTGVTAVGESYDASGARAETHVGPLMQWGG